MEMFIYNEMLMRIYQILQNPKFTAKKQVI